MLIPTVRVVVLSLGVLSSPLWGQTFELLHSFPADGQGGTHPEATLTIGPDGKLYGTASEGGPGNEGLAFRISTGGEFEIVGDFDTATTGRTPVARLINIGDGFLYGATQYNGSTAGDPEGTVYRLDPATGLSVVFQLGSSTNPFPSNPKALVSGEPNVLHVLGFDPGGLWRVPLDGSTRTITKVFNQVDRTVEGVFHTNIIRGSDGMLYGGTTSGGLDQDGVLYRMAPDGTGFTRLHSCETETGFGSFGALVEGPDGNFYGAMEEGGDEGNGVIFRLTPTGEYTVVHHFDDFRYPNSDLTFASDGYLYGTAYDLGTGGNGNGGIFRLKSDGTGYKVLHTFPTSNTAPSYPDGRRSRSGLVQAADGFLYGVTREGGAADKGTIFRIDLGLPANRAPIAVDDFAVSTGAEVAVNVKANDFDADGEVLTVTLVSDPEFGAAVVQGNGSILYTPNGSYGGFDTFTYKITDPRAGSSTAVVTIQNTQPGPLVEAGTYQGLLSLHETDVPRGTFALKVQENGSFSGSFFSQKKRSSFRGSFEDNGTAVVQVNIPKQGRGVLFLAFKPGEPNTVFGAVAGPELWAGNAGPAVVSGSEKKQSYTVQIVADEESPQLPAGHGYGVLTIKPTGAVSMVGRLGDGSNLSWSSTLVQFPGFARVIPVYDEPVKDGAFAGFIFPDGTGFEGGARWVRGAAKKPTLPYALGFTGDATVRIAPFTPPTGTDPVIDLANGVVGVFGGPITTETGGAFTIDGKKITSEAPLRSLSINRKNGLFSGKMVVDGKTLSFKGAINQAAKDGAGCASVKGVTGAVELFQPIE